MSLNKSTVFIRCTDDLSSLFYDIVLVYRPVMVNVRNHL